MRIVWRQRLRYYRCVFARESFVSSAAQEQTENRNSSRSSSIIAQPSSSVLLAQDGRRESQALLLSDVKIFLVQFFSPWCVCAAADPSGAPFLFLALSPFRCAKHTSEALWKEAKAPSIWRVSPSPASPCLHVCMYMYSRVSFFATTPIQSNPIHPNSMQSNPPLHV